MIAIRHIVFDIGGVLIHFDPEIPYRQIIPDARERRWFLQNVCTHDWNLEQDRGRSWREAERELIARFADQEQRIRAYRENWRKMVPHEIRETVAIMKDMVRAGRDVTLLTNFAADTFEEARSIYPFLDITRGVTVSGRVGAVKPDPEIFIHHVNQFGLEPSASLFIDDNRNNVEAARSLGWNAIAYENAEALKADLERFDVCP